MYTYIDLARAKSEALVNILVNSVKQRKTSWLHIICMAELSYVLTTNFVACVPVRF